VDPVRVKVYGLFSLTRRRYVRQAIAGLVALVLAMIAWWFGWPVLDKRFGNADHLPRSMTVTLAILRHTPWLLGGVAVWKIVEMWFVLRLFARKEKSAAVASEPTSQPTTSSAS
jgi:hypothetical protein